MNNTTSTSRFAPYFEIDETPIVMKIGGTTYEISMHFNTKGNETILQQFEALIFELDLV